MAVPRRTARLLVAALAAAIVAPAQAPLQARIAEALDKARPALEQHLRKADLGTLALCCLAAVHDGMARDAEPLQDALKRLLAAEIEDTYGLALRLMVLAELPDLTGAQDLAARDTELLLGRQTTGGFSYHAHDGWWDLSNTQYAALGLRAAAALGQDVPLQRWRLLYQALQRAQLEDGSFTYRPGQGRPSAYASMTVAGIAVLQVCAQQLEIADAERRYLDGLLEKAWHWLADRSDVIGNRRERACLYFHYGLERAAILCDQELVGGVDWYKAGATMLCDEQLAGGGWWGSDETRPDWRRTSVGHPVDTAFAVLFLRRKFQKVQAPVTGAGGCRSAVLPADATDESVQRAAAADAAAGERHVPQLLECLRSDVVARRKAATLALFQIAKQDFGIQPYRAPEADAEAIRRAELWWLRRRSAGR